MSQYFQVHPADPQVRLVRRAADIIRGGGVVAYPTDSSYALGARIGCAAALERIRRIRRVGPEHNFTLVCGDLSALSHYARVDNNTYRLLRRFTPGPYTFILQATREVPRRLQHAKRRSIGLRVPDFPVVAALLAAHAEPLLSSTLILPGDELPLNDAQVIREKLENEVDLIIDSGPCDGRFTSVIDLLTGAPIIARRGRGDVSAFE